MVSALAAALLFPSFLESSWPLPVRFNSRPVGSVLCRPINHIRVSGGLWQQDPALYAA